MLHPDFLPLGNYFNLSMTYRLNADIPHRYGRFVQVAPHPTTSHDLNRIVREFAAVNTHLATKEKQKSDEEVFATQFVTKCLAPSGRNAIAH